MQTHSAVEELFLHTNRGVLRYSTGREAKAADCSLDEFVDWPLASQTEVVRILGTRENAAVIVKLHNRRLQGGLPAIYVGSPSLCQPGNASAVFRQLQRLEYPPSVGGWHSLTAGDYVSYALIEALRESEGVYNDHVATLFAAHPACSALTFISSLSRAWAARLLAAMVDPRFNIDPSSPDEPKLLNKYFGLGRRDGVKNVKAFLDPNTVCSGVGSGRAECVLMAWSRGWTDKQAQTTIPPRDFLMRVVQRVIATKDVPVSLLRSSYVFLRYLRLSWLDALMPERAQFRQWRPGTGAAGSATKVTSKLMPRKNYSPTMFVPEYFFVNKDEALAWRKHTFGNKGGGKSKKGN